MAGLNKVMLIGNVGTDPEMRYTANGNAVTTFRLACSRNYTTPDGERKEETEWFTVVAWGKLAEFCGTYLSKGRQVYVEGTLRTRTYEDEKGNRRYFTEVRAQTIQLLGPKPGAGETPGGPAGEAPEVPPEGDEDIPF